MPLAACGSLEEIKVIDAGDGTVGSAELIQDENG
jgi:hypothetical protein